MTSASAMTRGKREDGMLTYDEQKRLAREGTIEERCALAARPDIKP